MPPVSSLSAPAPPCPHERGAGTTVCLRCRADAHQHELARHRTIAARVGVGLACAMVVVVAGNGVIAARQQAQDVRRRDGDTATVADMPMRSFTVTQASASAVVRAAPTPSRPVISVSAGRTELPGGAYIEREGDSVAVHFDTPTQRTRRRDKFEDQVRGTLPRVYGALADSALAAVPRGALGGAGDLLRDLPAHGIALPARDGWALTVWPGVRPGQDGPLVVSYRISLDRAR